MNDKKHDLMSRFRSVQFALTGIKQMFIAEPNVKIHFIATVFVIAYGCYKGLSNMQWIAIVFAVAIVWITEAINTAIEMVCDMYCKGAYDPMVKKIKDLSAAAVLIASLTSVIIALFVFL